ncbi:hypothetical protein [Arenimonas fontis]|uniref:VanZ family protein n=1 Tax=Arenimonas fontis TaxID=2608255 RepID=A0A5B2Z7X7_9GAMM|nr:hypothetical protein [Arenimonas fontis]KAA2283997.1 hypothetical protein F0415_11430 [Arenimonas fontis]
MSLRRFHRPRLWLSLWALGWLLCIALSLSPPVPLAMPPGSDKLGHLLSYFLLAAWAAMLFRGPRALLPAGLSLLLLGAGLEVLQATLTEQRLGEWQDLAANALGIAAGLAVAGTRAAAALEWLDGAMAGKRGREAGERNPGA